MLFRNVNGTGAMVLLENRLGGNVLSVAYISRHDMIKALAYICLVLPSNISLIFSSTLISTAAEIALYVDLYPSLTLFL